MVARFNIGLPDTQNHPLIQGIIDGVSNTRKCYPRYGRVRKMLSLKVLSSHTPVRPKLFFTTFFFSPEIGSQILLLTKTSAPSQSVGDCKNPGTGSSDVGTNATARDGRYVS